MKFADQVKKLIDAYDTGQVNENSLAAMLQIALYEKVSFDQKVFFAHLTQSNGKLQK